MPREVFMQSLQVLRSVTDTITDASQAIQNDESLSDAFNNALAAVPGLLSAFGQIGQQAPVVSVVFAVLDQASQYYSSVIATTESYRAFSESVKTTTQVVNAVEQHQKNHRGVNFTSPVRAARVRSSRQSCAILPPKNQSSKVR